MRVLHIQFEVPHYKQEFFRRLAATPGYDYTLLLLRCSSRKAYAGNLTAEELSAIGIQLVELQGRTLQFRRFTLDIYPGLVRHILRLRPDVILEGGITLFASKYLDTAICFLLKALLGIRFVGGWSGSCQSDRGWFYDLIRRINFKLAFSHFDSFVTYGEQARQVLIERGAADRKVFVGYNSLDTDKLTALKQRLEATRASWEPGLRGRLRIGSRDKVVLFLSRITPEKRLDLVLRAFPEIYKADPSVCLLIVGDGGEAGGYHSLAPGLNCAHRILFEPGAYDDEDVARYFLLAQVVVYPGWISLSTHFAMVMGKPFVCVPLGNELEYAVDGQNAFHFQPDDTADLASKVVRLLRDPALQARFGAASQALVATKANLSQKVRGYREAVSYACRLRGGAS